MTDINFNDNYIGKLHKVINNERNKHEILYAHYFDRMQTYLYNIKELKHANNAEDTRNRLIIIYIEEYNRAKDALKYHQHKLKWWKVKLATIHRIYSKRGIESIKSFKYIIEKYGKHI